MHLPRVSPYFGLLRALDLLVSGHIGYAYRRNSATISASPPVWGTVVHHECLPIN